MRKNSYPKSIYIEYCLFYQFIQITSYGLFNLRRFSSPGSNLICIGWDQSASSWARRTSACMPTQFLKLHLLHELFPSLIHSFFKCGTKKQEPREKKYQLKRKTKACLVSFFRVFWWKFSKAVKIARWWTVSEKSSRFLKARPTMELKICLTFLKQEGFSSCSNCIHGIIYEKRYFYTKQCNLDLLFPSFILIEVGKGEQEKCEVWTFLNKVGGAGVRIPRKTGG